MDLGERIGRLGIWGQELRSTGLTGQQREQAAELESLGYGAIWLGGSPGVEHARPLLAATERVVVATGILNIWQHKPSDVAAETAAVERDHPGRLLLGLGVSHSQLITQYHRPYAAMVDFLDGLDASPTPVPPSRRVLAALGPRMLRLAVERAAGAHPYMAPLEHTAAAREVLGAGPLLAPEINVVVETDPATARAAARAHLEPYLAMTNYTNNFRRFGFTDDDLAGGGSDRLVDALYLWGDPDRIRSRALAFHDAGADHLAVQVVRPQPTADLPMVQYRALASALGG
ncbi:LLM class F420-dependent oxidoreductase [Dactylosporangium fulvum]|uniref:LLM class F420-dependent oxidoreductase n=1 Tax=Dactylosporangium fulvum TaxID=53359 RepID=A0ABY5W875_9ACTN|nr:LLM class F420-dependent oxidoreductase [Dactylosporangium fulvum]UWP84266.1 LLM class F420-dependent oxidoreductase [Dactylosporangium fulvum]